MRIPITMIHGYHESFAPIVALAAQMGFESISYDELAAWRFSGAALPERPIMFDFDHPIKNTRYECHELLSSHGYAGNLFVNTGAMDELYAAETLPAFQEREVTTWEELGELMEAGWTIGAHTVTHPSLSELSLEDPDGSKIAWELDHCVETLRANLGVAPKDFAFTGTSWSSAAEAAVKQRFRFGRLWIVGSQYNADGQAIRYADLVGVEGEDEEDGGPPYASRYITEQSDPYRLPSMEVTRLIEDIEAARRYLEMALEA